MFDFANEIHEYCIADVQLLNSCCIKFRGAFITDIGIDPFQRCTGDHGRSVLVAIPARLKDNIKLSANSSNTSNNLKSYDVYSKQPESFYGVDCYIGEH